MPCLTKTIKMCFWPSTHMLKHTKNKNKLQITQKPKHKHKHITILNNKMNSK